MEIGASLPPVTLIAADDTAFDLAGIAGPLVVYFYPKDDTSGCTREAIDFTEHHDAFEEMGVRVLGVSKDPPARHRRFVEKHALRVALASDMDGRAAEAFGVWGEKRLYGRTYMGIERATFLFDREARLRQVWRKVRVAGHAQAVLDAARTL